jgi:hypothetical protein
MISQVLSTAIAEEMIAGDHPGDHDGRELRDLALQYNVLAGTKFADFMAERRDLLDRLLGKP